MLLPFILLGKFQIDSGTTGTELHFGQTYISAINGDSYEDLTFLFFSHNYLKNKGHRHFLFESHLGINKNLITQEVSNASFKNILAGFIIGQKFKYFRYFNTFIPEWSYGFSFNIISNNIDDETVLFSFLVGGNIGAGVTYSASSTHGYGIKCQLDAGYNTYIKRGYDRKFIYMFSIFLTFDYYDGY